MTASNADQARHCIMLNVKANGLPVTGELWFALILMTEAQLRQVCHEMNIIWRN